MIHQNTLFANERDAELIAVLSAISQVSGRMARNLELIANQRQSQKGDATYVKSKGNGYDHRGSACCCHCY